MFRQTFLFLALLGGALSVHGQFGDGYPMEWGARKFSLVETPAIGNGTPTYLQHQMATLGVGPHSLNWIPGIDAWDAIWENPGWDREYDWDTTTTSWRLIKGRTYTYDAQGKLIERESSDYANGQSFPVYQYRYSYDAQGRLARRSTYFWSSGNWMLGGRASQRLDVHGNRTAQLGEDWNGVTWDTTYADSTAYTYVLGDKIASQEFSIWNPNSRHLERSRFQNWTYNSDSLELSHAEFRWDSTQWAPEGMELHTYDGGGTKLQTDLHVGFQGNFLLWQSFHWLGWHDQTHDLPLHYHLDEYSLDSAHAVTRQVRTGITYLQYDCRRAVDSIWDGQAWTPSLMWRLTHDAHDHLRSFYLYTYDGHDSTFISLSRFNLSYDSQQKVIAEEYETAFIDSLNLRHWYRLEHGDFFLVTLDESLESTAVRAFPNPCNAMLSLELPLIPQEPVLTEIYDLRGNLRVKAMVPEEGTLIRIPLSETLENGHYFYRLRCGYFTAQGKFSVLR